MKLIREFSIGLIGLLTFAACVVLGTMIGFSLKPDLAGLGTAIIGFMISSLVGVFVAIAAAKFFADSIWVNEKEAGDSTTSQAQRQRLEEFESSSPEVEKQRVEKYGRQIVICSSCGTKNSLSFPRCIKCSKDLGAELPVDNPYL